MATYNYIGDANLTYMLTCIKNVLEGNSGGSGQTAYDFAPGYVKKETGKGLSANDFTDILLTKLNGITESADAVSVTQVVQTGTKVATVTINDTDIDIYVPTVTIDSAMSSSSENPVQNKVIKEYVDTAVGAVVQIKFDADTTGQGYTSLTDLQTKHPTGANGTIYLVQNTGTGTNTKDEYFWDSNSLTYEKFGSTDIDLSNYVQKTDLAVVSDATILAAFNNVFTTPQQSGS